MRLGLLTSSYPTYPGDVPGHFVQGFTRTLERLGHSVDVLTADCGRQPSNVAEPQGSDREAPIPAVRVRYMWPRSWQTTFQGSGVLNNLRQDPRAWPGLVSFPAMLYASARARVSSWDAVVTHWALPGGLVGASLAHRIPHLCVLHSADVHMLGALPQGRAIARWLAARSDTMWFVAEALRDKFSRLLPSWERRALRSRSLVSPMGISPGGVVNRPVEDGTLRVLSIGRLVPIKGLDLAIEAVRDLDNVEIVLAGAGPEAARLRALARHHRVKLSLPGIVRQGQKQELMRCSSVFILPSRIMRSGRSEGTPTALMEAMEVGLPVVASRVGGVPEICRDGREGLLIPPGCPDALRRALLRLRAPASRRMLGEHARRRGQQFHWDRLARTVQRALPV